MHKGDQYGRDDPPQQIDAGKNRKENQHNHGKEEDHHAALSAFLNCQRIVLMDPQVARNLSLLLGATHGAQKRNHAHRNQRHNQDRHNGIEHIGNGPDKYLQALALCSNAVLLQQTRKISSPARQRNEQTQWRGG